MANNNVTLSGTLGTLAAGATATFTPSGWLTDATNNLLLPPAPVVVRLDASGAFTVSLLATDNTAPTPSGWTWTAEFVGVQGIPPYSFSFFLPFSGGATQNIAALAQVPAVTPTAQYLPLPTGTPLAGQVPVATGTGEASAWATSPDYYSGQQLASGETVIPRASVGTGPALTSGNVQFTYWTATKTETCHNIAMVTASTAAGATPTYCAMGVYLVDGSGNLTQLAQCANDTTLFNTTFGTNTRALTTPFNKVAGQRYCMGVLVVSAAAMPNFFGYGGTIAMGSVAPRLFATLTGQTVLPASVAAGSLTGVSNMYFGAVTP